MNANQKSDLARRVSEPPPTPRRLLSWLEQRARLQRWLTGQRSRGAQLGQVLEPPAFTHRYCPLLGKPCFPKTPRQLLGGRWAIAGLLLEALHHDGIECFGDVGGVHARRL